MSELLKRALTGAVYVALTLGAAYAGAWTTLLLFLPVCAMAARELHLLYWRHPEEAPSIAWPMVLSVVFYLAVALSALSPRITGWHVGACALVLFSAAAVDLLRGNDAAPAQALGAHALTLLIVALPFGLITHFIGPGPEKLVGFMLLLWTNDTGAYLVGRGIGRTKLMPAVSPKKTVEGLIGGIALTALAAWGLFHLWPVLSLTQWIGCALVVSVFATLGDLLESALKRARGVKDSGSVLPGHGGILDRFDGFLLAAPAMLVCIHLCA
ncbi:MAG: phosphatidate cytidylyltransferase [Flavobacteriales bacterium]